VKLVDGAKYKGKNNFNLKGILVCMDGLMNICLEKVEELEDGEVTKYNDVFLRGNNGKSNL
jgi:small nuclear ribonucleoprotein (snRNP)-like protein